MTAALNDGRLCFHARKRVAPLKLDAAGLSYETGPEFPRAQARGSIEALASSIVSPISSPGFHARKRVAPLKRINDNDGGADNAWVSTRASAWLH